jgi:hypothetical protein
MAGWTDAALGVAGNTREEREHRKTYVDVLDHMPDGGVVEHHRADGSCLKISIAGASSRGASVSDEKPYAAARRER